MAKQVINIGTTANDGTGDPLRTAFDKVNDNTTELYAGQSLSIVSDILTLTRADGTTSTVDLSSYLDEDARAISSGTLNGGTGIVTFTRDDASTFTLDLSALLDDTNIVTSVNTQTGAVVLDADDIDDTSTTNKFTSSADISKLAGIEAGADITDTTNVEAAGALMDSEVTDLAGIKSVTISTLQPKPIEGAFVDGDKTKLDGIAAGAGVNTVDSVNSQTGAVVLDSDDISEGSTNLYNQTHTGDVTGSVALTIAANAVTNAKINNGAVGFTKLSTTMVITNAEGIASNNNDTTIPTSAAVASYVGSNSPTYSAGSGLDESSGIFSVEADLRDGITHIGVDTGDFIQFTADTQMDFYVNSLNQMRLEADGDLHVEGDVIAASTTVSSDENLKKDISTYKDALKTISELNGVSFAWKSNDKKSGGVIAQDVQKVLPELVGTKKSLEGGEETLTVDYNGLIGVLIQAVKELSKQVEELKK